MNTPSIAAFLGFFSCALWCFIPQTGFAQPIFINGAARVESSANLSATAAKETVLAAVEALHRRLDRRAVRCYLVTDNLGAPEAVAAVLRQSLTNAPWAGLANNWGDYLPVDRDTLGSAVVRPRGIVVTAVAGELDAELQMVDGLTKRDVSYDLPKEEWRRRWDEQGPAHAGRAEALVRKFHFTARSGQTNVLMLTGTMHTPRQEYVFAGARRALPSGVLLIGGSGADFSTVYFNGQRFNDALLALRLSGSFRAVAGGTKGGGAAQVARSLPVSLKALTEGLKGAKPAALIYFGCAGWGVALPEQQRLLEQFLPAGTGVYGQFCGGEFGRLHGASEFRADTDLGLLVALGPIMNLP